MSDHQYKDKYLKYKKKFLELYKNNQMGGARKYRKNKNDRKHQLHKEPHKHIEHVSEPWFTLISLGLKTVEGRKNKGKFKEMKVNDLIEWRNNDFNPRTVVTRITKKNTYTTFEDYLRQEGLENCLPGIKDIQDGKSVYFKYYTKEQEQQYGVVAIGLKVVQYPH